MHIAIAQKLRPFSHRPGTRCLIPFTTWEAQIFPSKIFFQDLDTGNTHDYTLPIKGPVKSFTILQDLEKCRIEVFGKGAEGYFRYFLTADGIQFKNNGEKLPFLTKTTLPPSQTRLSLGMHKKQDWDLVQRRKEMAEVFPFWYRLAQVIPFRPFHHKGTGSLIAAGKLDLAFEAAFEGILCPRMVDKSYLGIIPEEKIPDLSPIGHIHEGARQIQEFFFQEEKGIWSILPNLPKEFHAGRLIKLQTTTLDVIDLEWSKKEIKKIIIRPTVKHSIQLDLHSRIKSFRLRHNLGQKGTQLPKNGSLQLLPNAPLYLDRFMH